MPYFKVNSPKKLRQRSGQILVEYLLLMVIAVGCATLLVKGLVGRKESDTGIIIKQWHKIITTIGNDVPDCTKQTDFNRANCPP